MLTSSIAPKFIGMACLYSFCVLYDSIVKLRRLNGGYKSHDKAKYVSSTTIITLESSTTPPTPI